MGRSVIEWNSNDVYQRKYDESWVIFEGPNNTLEQEFVYSATPGGWITSKHKTGVISKCPVYFPIESGYYLSPNNDTFFLERKYSHTKFFKIGVSNENWCLYRVNNNGDYTKISITTDNYIDLLNPPDKKKFYTRNIGIVDRKYFLSHHDVHFKGNKIGSREGKVIILDNHYFAKDLATILGPLWEIS